MAYTIIVQRGQIDMSLSVTNEDGQSLTVSRSIEPQRRVIRDTPKKVRIYELPQGFEYINVDIKKTAKLIREDLEKAYPLTKFSVRTQKMSGGTSSVNVRWQSDGPEMDEVDAFLARYEGSVSDESGDFRDNCVVLIEDRWYHFQPTFISCQRETMVITL